MKKENLLNFVIGVLAILILIVIYFKIINKSAPYPVKVNNIKKVMVYDINDNKYFLKDLMDNEEDNIFLIFEIDNCGSCIDKGYAELSSFEKNGKDCFAIVVYDRPEELAGYEKNFKSKNFLIIKRAEYYEYIKAPHLPILFNIKKSKVDWFRYITF